MSQTAPRLSFFPINLFGAIMGFAGLTLCLQKAQQLIEISELFFVVMALITSLLFTVITVVYLIKLIKYPDAAIKEFNHPIALHFFPTFSISLLLMSLIFKDFAYQPAQYMWVLGTVVQFGLLLYILSNWIHQENWEITHMTPAWFIPVVGTIVVPLGAVHFGTVELGWFFFSIGLVFWILLNSIVMYRLFFHSPMMKVLQPTLFILIAPPAVGFISYMSLNGMAGVNEFSRILFYTGFFMTLLLFSQSIRFFKLPFALSWWAYTFPIAAITLATFIMFEQLELAIFKYIAIFLLLVLASLIVHLTAKTIWAIKNKTLCVPLDMPPQSPIEPTQSPDKSER